ncbi:MAG: 4-(cytidine 5'-diphospho)-2-C-methyl-D-erythritol kinase [Prevotellaceae bacterium]|nr:4-(cytidine 5'-diphospho)-2-C-methyl-D-erythritol kinase [Prevotellaceae bacterium]
MRKAKNTVLHFSNAKINLGLHVTQKRADGFHNIETLFVPVAWRDMVEVLPAPAQPDVSISCTGLPIEVEPEKNLCVRAYRLLQKEVELPAVQIFLHKIVPSGAGLGGGSSNAAVVLCALNRLFSLALSQKELQSYAAQLGSDCAFFTYNTPMLATGRGEILQPAEVKLQGYELLIVKPPVSVSTAEAYAGVTPRQPASDLQSIVRQPLSTWKESLVNDFEPSVFAKFPQLRSVKNQLYSSGAVYAAMSGSGSSLFGIFEKAPENAAQVFEGCTVFRQGL